MPGTCLVSSRSALIDALAAEDDLKDAEVTFQFKAGSSKRERIFTTHARATHTPAALKAGRNFRNEVGRFDLVILVERVGKSAESASDRAADLGLVVEEFIADHKNNELSVTGMQTLQVEGDVSLTEMFGDSGNLAELVIPVKFTARLQ